MYKVASLMKYNISRWRSRYHILLGVVYLFCIWRKKVVGVCLIGTLLTLPKVVEALNFTTFYWLSPYSWICLDTTRKVYNGALPSIRYGISMLCAVIVFLLILIYISGKKQNDLLV